MKKRVLVSALACALGAACIFGATACDNSGNGGSKGNEVTEEQWKAAFDELIAAENYTVQATFEMNSGEQRGTYYVTTNAALSEINETYPNGEEVTLYYYYIHEDGADFCIYNNPEAVSSWDGDIQSDCLTNAKKKLTYYFTAELSNTESSAALKDLYSEFTYADGAYTATLSAVSELDFNITIKFTGGKISYYVLDGHREDEDGGTIRNKITMEMSNYGTTVVTLPEGAPKVLDEYIAANK